jgi:glycosyltransferase involved in cell wall biosynthesis
VRIYLNRRPVIGPWGGGNRFVTELQHQLLIDGHEVTYDIGDYCDAHVCFDPRPNDVGVTFADIIDVNRRQRFMKVDNVKLICRVGDVGTHGKNALTFQWAKALERATDIVFPSEWARDRLMSYVVTDDVKSSILSRTSIITNGADRRFVDAYRTRSFVMGTRPNVVTHHWSDNPMKGFDVYAHVNAVVDDDDMRFTYIGRSPSWCVFKNAIPPCDIDGLIANMQVADVYLTASRFEAGANHVLEAMALGLPVVYPHDGGSIVEYCHDYGVEYDGTGTGAVDAIHRCHQLATIFPRYTRTTVDTVREFIGVITR